MGSSVCAIQASHSETQIRARAHLNKLHLKKLHLDNKCNGLATDDQQC